MLVSKGASGAFKSLRNVACKANFKKF